MLQEKNVHPYIPSAAPDLANVVRGRVPFAALHLAGKIRRMILERLWS